MRAAALELIESGYGRFSMVAVAKRAMVHETSVYRRWGKKEALVADLGRAVIDARLPVPDTGSLFEDLSLILNSTIELVNTPIGASLTEANVAARLGDELAEFAIEYWRDRLSMFETIFARAKARGEWPEHQPWRACVDCLSGALHFRLFLTKEGADAAYVAEILDAVLPAAAKG